MFHSYSFQGIVTVQGVQIGLVHLWSGCDVSLRFLCSAIEILQVLCFMFMFYVYVPPSCENTSKRLHVVSLLTIEGRSFY